MYFQSFLLRWLVNVLGLWAAAGLINGITYQQRFGVLVWAALIFSLVNALVKPVVILLTLPAVILSLGLFMLVINALMLYLVTLLYHSFHIATFGSAVLAAFIIWLVNYLFSTVTEKVPQPSQRDRS